MSVSPEAPTPELKTYYDVLDVVARYPGVYLGGLNAAEVRGSRMVRLQAFLLGLGFADLEPGAPPFHDFGPWLAVRMPGCHDRHNAPFHWLERDEADSDTAFDRFFEYLAEYRRCTASILRFTEGPFRPTFAVDGEARRIPKSPHRVVVGRYLPSPVYFWRAEPALPNALEGFASSLRTAQRQAERRWQPPTDSWIEAPASSEGAG